MIFISSPYSSPLAELQRDRYNKVTEFTILMLAAGYQVFSPITYCVPMATVAKLPQNAAHWERFNIEFLRHSEAMFLLHLPGWDQSKGVQVELKIAKALGIPVVHFNERFEEIKQDIPGEATPRK